MPERQRMTTRLKTLFQRPELFVLAGGINPIGARMAETLGYDAFYMSGGNTSAHQLGWPDSGTSMRDMVDNARKIVLSVQIPVFADADTGYGDAINRLEVEKVQWDSDKWFAVTHIPSGCRVTQFEIGAVVVG